MFRNYSFFHFFPFHSRNFSSENRGNAVTTRAAARKLSCLFAAPRPKLRLLLSRPLAPLSVLHSKSRIAGSEIKEKIYV